MVINELLLEIEDGDWIEREEGRSLGHEMTVDLSSDSGSSFFIIRDSLADLLPVFGVVDPPAVVVWIVRDFSHASAAWRSLTRSH